MRVLIVLALIAGSRAPCLQGQVPDSANSGFRDSVRSRERLQLRVAVAGEGRYVQHRVDDGTGLEVQSGTIFGGLATILVGPHVEVGAGGATGTLNADSGNAFTAKLTRGEAHVAVLPVPWLALRVGGAIHTFGTSFAKQRWTSMRVGGEGRAAFIGGKLEGLLRFELYPVVSVSGLAKPNRGFGAASGLTFSSGMAVLSLLYEFERYDFPQVSGLTRHEQLGTLVMGVGLRF